jgi:hypothetical protein
MIFDEVRTFFLTLWMAAGNVEINGVIWMVLSGQKDC